MEYDQRKQIGQRIKRLRYNVGVSQKVFASMIGVSPASQSAYELGDVLPSVPILIKMCEVGNVSLDWLVRGIS